MPASARAPTVLIDTLTPVTATNSDDQPAFSADHAWFWVDFTLGSLASCTVAVQFAYWDSSSGPVWDAVYDSQQTTVDQTFTADFNGWVIATTQHNNTRQTPLAFGTRFWRVTVAASGTNTSSSIKVQGQPFSVGSVRE